MTHEDLMRGVTIQHLLFTVRPLESMVFPDQPGTALRGALYQALSRDFCSEPNDAITPDHQERCPVCWLLSRERDDYQRGRNIPRPLTIEPPQPRAYHHDELLTFGLSLIGRAQDLFPYLARAVQKMGQEGVGKGRGRFRLINIAEGNPLFDAQRSLMNGNHVSTPTLQVTPSRVTEASTKGQPNRITLELLTPLRLTDSGHLVKRPEPIPFVRRLLERCQSLATFYAEVENPVSQQAWREVDGELTEVARQLKIAYDDTYWLDVWSGSKRQGRYTPIGGLVGVFRWEGAIEPLRSWLLWGQSLHVGKDTVKGNGWYRITG